MSYALGCSDHEIWFNTYQGLRIGHLYIGGEVMGLDYSDDGKKLIAATSFGQVIIYDCSNMFTVINYSVTRRTVTKKDRMIWPPPTPVI